MKVQSLVRQDDSVYYQVEGRNQWLPPRWTIAFSATFLLHLWTKELGHCPIMLDKICKLLKAFQVTTSEWYFPVPKGPQVTEPPIVVHLFKVWKYGVLFMWCPWKYFSCWLQISPFFICNDIIHKHILWAMF